MPSHTPKSAPKIGVLYAMALLVIVIDQISKAYFYANYTLHESHAVIDGLFNFTLAHNHGAAFSFLAQAGGWQKWFFVALGLIVALGIMMYLPRIDKRAHALKLGFMMVMAGALGNVIDRARLGYVIDFIHIYYQDWHYPIFNVADMAICAGAFLLIVDALFLEKKRT